MRLLLDTHVVIWTLYGGRELSRRAVQALSHAEAELFVSVASIWEVGIKRPLARQGFAVPDSFVEDMAAASMQVLPTRPAHAWSVQHLEHRHGDPFDRLLVAQARAERLTLLSRDRLMRGYGVALIEA